MDAFLCRRSISNWSAAKRVQKHISELRSSYSRGRSRRPNFTPVDCKLRNAKTLLGERGPNFCDLTAAKRTPPECDLHSAQKKIEKKQKEKKSGNLLSVVVSLRFPPDFCLRFVLHVFQLPLLRNKCTNFLSGFFCVVFCCFFFQGSWGQKQRLNWNLFVCFVCFLCFREIFLAHTEH